MINPLTPAVAEELYNNAQRDYIYAHAQLSVRMTLASPPVEEITSVISETVNHYSEGYQLSGYSEALSLWSESQDSDGPQVEKLLKLREKTETAVTSAERIMAKFLRICPYPEEVKDSFRELLPPLKEKARLFGYARAAIDYTKKGTDELT